MKRTLSKDATDFEIKNLVIEWTELLAEEKYAEALSLFPHSDKTHQWTPKLLKDNITNYGVIDANPETLNFMLEEYEVDKFIATSILSRNDKDTIISNSIDVDRENLYGLPKEEYLGMVYFKDFPLSGYLSDLTAQFYIKKVEKNEMTLEFVDLHVM